MKHQIQAPVPSVVRHKFIVILEHALSPELSY
jgi:hypothetical protein